MGLVDIPGTQDVIDRATGPGGYATPIRPGDKEYDPRAQGAGMPVGDYGAEAEFQDTKNQARELYAASKGLTQLGIDWSNPEVIRDIDAITADIVKSRDVTVGPLAPVQGVTAPTIGPAAQTELSTVQRTNLDTTQSDELRGRQLGQITSLEDQAAGRGPTASGALFDAALGRISQEQLGAAGMARGSERAGAKLQALSMIGRQGVQAAADKAALAIQERTAGQQLLTSALSGVRGQDVDVAAKAADLRAQANALEAQIRSAEAQGNTAAVNALKSQQAALQLQADSLTAQMTNQRTIDEATLRAGVDTGNATREQEAATTNAANNITATSLTNQQRIARDTAAADKAAKEFALKGQTIAAGIGAGTGATNITGTAAANIIGARGTYARDEVTRRNAEAAANKGKSLTWGGVAGGVIGGIAGGFAGGPAGIVPGAVGGYQIGDKVYDKPVSDERAKTDIESISPAELRRLAEGMDGATYRYKPGQGPPGRHIGPMAQDLARDPVGALAVSEDERGIMHLDTSEIARLALMMSASALRGRKAA
jgi:hypothetical protein